MRSGFVWLCSVALIMNAISLYLLSHTSEYLAASFVLTACILYMVCKCTTVGDAAEEVFTYHLHDMV